ncbi:hypothetical protein DFJ67_0903 [Asanoa ferruginea]|uniref:VCBS repeat protein n=1 Tax=Asanoa ferruginea TaxID=53367 RepID=A0A3D9ZCH1_9ACTN|nr:hypothetical protein [Asanoa ferruginea]REF94957.1 hypothetical protein DFJ67_0903 [Asanoa ferruginea]GIF45464.1 hypothetical protein Afe04nite_00030 [Asanoa ferruginea]
MTVAGTVSLSTQRRRWRIKPKESPLHLRRSLATLLSSVLVTGAGLVAFASPAHAGVIEIAFGNGGDVPLSGDFFGDERDELVLYRPSTATFYIRQWNGTVNAVPFGNAGDLPVIGDWDGNGIDNVGVYRPSNGRFYLERGDGNANDLPFGNGSGDLPVAGKWWNLGSMINYRDMPGVFRKSEGTFYLLNSNGSVAVEYPYASTDVPLAGKWKRTYRDEDYVGAYRPSTQRFYLKDPDTNTTRVCFFGNSGDKPVVGQWVVGASDSIGVWRPANQRFYLLDWVQDC